MLLKNFFYLKPCNKKSMYNKVKKTLKAARFITVLIKTDMFHSKKLVQYISRNISSNINVTNIPIFFPTFKP